jgi:hypothetical protein
MRVRAASSCLEEDQTTSSSVLGMPPSDPKVQDRRSEAKDEPEDMPVDGPYHQTNRQLLRQAAQ